jgi:hypothetical protein
VLAGNGSTVVVWRNGKTSGRMAAVKPRLALPIMLLAGLASAAGCETGQQPVECELFLTCFYPSDDSLSPDRVDGRQQSDAMRDEATAAFGRDGECWRNGEDDRFYKICQRTCVDILVDECDMGTERPCVVSSGGELRVEPPEWTGTEAPTCQELKDQAAELSAPDGE